VSQVSDLTSDRPLVERLPPRAPGGRSTPPDVELLIKEVAALAGLLAQVVELAEDGAIFPSRWKAFAKHAMEHHSVHAALRAAQGDA